ncbi:MAG: chemotaxis protein CheW [Burkholderiales bacterium]|nr:chemotaxis protein CheW [Burkholderiales bacterium]MCW5603777.1 chemotaxis protein CheW [Burkholderiales bacterium]
MNDIVPDAASFLADMPLLEDLPAAGGPSGDDGAAVPDLTAYLLGEDAGAPGGASDSLLPPSLALDRRRDGAPGVVETYLGGVTAVAASRLGFKIGNLRLFMPFDEASELSEMMPVYRIPNVPAWFRGLANLHGNLVPVVDLSGMAGLTAGQGKSGKLLVVGRGGGAIGVMIDGIPERIPVDSTAAVDVPDLPPVLRGCVSGARLHRDEVWLELRSRQFAEAVEKMIS